MLYPAELRGRGSGGSGGYSRSGKSWECGEGRGRGGSGEGELCVSCGETRIAMLSLALTPRVWRKTITPDGKEGLVCPSSISGRACLAGRGCPTEIVPCRNASNIPRASSRWSSSSRIRPRTRSSIATLDKLRDGVSTKTMLTASALAVTRSSELPPGHHGGPLHPLAGLYAISNLVERLEGEEKFLPGAAARRAVQQAHPPPGDGARTSCSNSQPMDAGGVEATKAAFLTACGRGECEQGRPSVPVAVEQHPADRGLRSADERGDPEERARRPLLHLPGLRLARVRDRRHRRRVLHAADAAGGALCDALPGRPAASREIEMLIKEYRPAEQRHPPARPATTRPSAIGRLGKPIRHVEEYVRDPRA